MDYGYSVNTESFGEGGGGVIRASICICICSTLISCQRLAGGIQDFLKNNQRIYKKVNYNKIKQGNIVKKAQSTVKKCNRKNKNKYY